MQSLVASLESADANQMTNSILPDDQLAMIQNLDA